MSATLLCPTCWAERREVTGHTLDRDRLTDAEIRRGRTCKFGHHHPPAKPAVRKQS